MARRHGRFYMAMAEQAEQQLCGPEQGAWLERLEREQSNLRAALDWMAASGETEWGLRMATALGRFWEMRGHLSEGRQRLTALLSHEERTRRGGAQGEPAGLSGHELARARPRALLWAGTLAQRQGNFRIGRSLHRQCLAAARAVGDLPSTAAALYGLGFEAQCQGRDRSARACLEESLAIRRAVGDRCGAAKSLVNLGQLALHDGKVTEARLQFQESLAIRRELADKGGIAASLCTLGEMAQEEGDLMRPRSRCSLKVSLCFGSWVTGWASSSPSANWARPRISWAMSRERWI